MPARTSRNPSPEEKASQSLRDLFARPHSEWDLVWHHKVGEHLNRLFPTGDRAYGHSQIERLAQVLDVPPSKLWQVQQFFHTYSRSEVRELAKSLTWSHIVLLLSLDEEERLVWQERCLEGGWSTRELRSRVKRAREPQSQGGRRLRKIKDVQTALQQLIDESRMWLKRYHEVWFHPEDPAIQLEPDKYKDPDVGALAAEAEKVLKDLQYDLEEGLLRVKSLKVPVKPPKKPTKAKKPKRQTRKRG